MASPNDQIEGLLNAPLLRELLRLVRRDGAQHVPVQDGEVVILDSKEYQRLKGAQTGITLLEALQACPYPDEDIVPESERSPVSSDLSL